MRYRDIGYRDIGYRDIGTLGPWAPGPGPPGPPQIPTVLVIRIVEKIIRGRTRSLPEN